MKAEFERETAHLEAVWIKKLQGLESKILALKSDNQRLQDDSAQQNQVGRNNVIATQQDLYTKENEIKKLNLIIDDLKLQAREGIANEQRLATKETEIKI